jgi:predicted RND superfamily exporter protein
MYLLFIYLLIGVLFIFIIELLVDYLSIKVSLTPLIRIVIVLTWPWGLPYLVIQYYKYKNNK